MKTWQKIAVGYVAAGVAFYGYKLASGRGFKFNVLDMASNVALWPSGIYWLSQTPKVSAPVPPINPLSVAGLRAAGKL